MSETCLGRKVLFSSIVSGEHYNEFEMEMILILLDYGVNSRVGALLGIVRSWFNQLNRGIGRELNWPEVAATASPSCFNSIHKPQHDVCGWNQNIMRINSLFRVFWFHNRNSGWSLFYVGTGQTEKAWWGGGGEVRRGGRSFWELWRVKQVSYPITPLLAAVNDSAHLRHVSACYTDDCWLGGWMAFEVIKNDRTTFIAPRATVTKVTNYFQLHRFLNLDW